MQCGERASTSRSVSDDTGIFMLASSSATRRRLLESAGLKFYWKAARIDEAAVVAGLIKEGEKPRNVAPVLADLKARRVGQKNPEMLTVGCDQILEFNGLVVQKSCSVDEARSTLKMLRGKRHLLHSAAVAYEGMRPVWRHISTVRLAMRNFSDNYLEDYLTRHGREILDSVGCYRVEDEGIRLFSSIKGDWFAVLGIPLTEFINFLYDRGQIRE